MSDPTPIKYTLEDGGQWIEGHARSTFLGGGLERYCKAWCNFQTDEVRPDRRIPICLEEVPGVVLAAAVALPNGRILDAVLGCFRDETDTIKRLDMTAVCEVKRAPRLVAQAAFYAEKFDS